MGTDLAAVPEAHRDAVAGALHDAFGAHGASRIDAIGGGASGALTFRVETSSGPHFLRVETIRGPLRNPHQYECLRIAADAAIAPPVRHLDEQAGVLIVPFVEARPLSEFPGGAAALAVAAGSLLRRLHDTERFPAHGDHLDNLARLIGFLEASGRVAPGLLAPHADGLAQLAAAYPWEPEHFVSAHNDPNQSNLLFDGDRLWLIDWETASRNDPMVDIASVCAHLAPTDELREILLGEWLGRPADDVERARLVVMTLLGQLFAGAILLMIVTDPATPVHDDLTAMMPDAFGAAVARGELVVGEPRTMHAFAKLMLDQFLVGLDAPQTRAALDVLAS